MNEIYHKDQTVLFGIVTVYPLLFNCYGLLGLGGELNYFTLLLWGASLICWLISFTFPPIMIRQWNKTKARPLVSWIIFGGIFVINTALSLTWGFAFLRDGIV